MAQYDQQYQDQQLQQQQQEEKLAEEIRLIFAARKLHKITKAFVENGQIVFKAIENTEQAKYIAQAVQHSIDKMAELNMPEGLRESTVHNWAANLTQKYVDKGYTADAAVKFATEYAHTIASMPLDMAMRTAGKLGLEGTNPHTPHLENLAAIAEQNRMEALMVAIDNMKAFAATRPDIDLAESIATIQNAYPAFQQGDAMNTALSKGAGAVLRDVPSASALANAPKPETPSAFLDRISQMVYDRQFTLREEFELDQAEQKRPSSSHSMRMG